MNLKIYHIISSIDLSSGGPSKSVCELALQQAKLGHKVTIITRITENPYYRHSPHNNLDIVLLKKNEFKCKLKYYIKLSKPDILHGHGLWLLEVHYMASLARKFKIPYIISPRGMLEPWALQYKNLKKQLALLLYQRKDLEKANCIHTTSSIEAENIRKLGFKNKISIIPNPVNIQPGLSVNNEKSNSIKQIAYIGRLHPIKNLENLLLAWAKVKQNQNWQLILVGYGEKQYVEKLKKIVSQYNLINVVFAGFLTGIEKERLIQSIDLLILPSHSENFGMVVGEALQYEIPVIASTGTPWQDLQTYQCGWWVSNDVDTLARTIEEAISLSDEERKQMGKRGRKLIEEKYNIEKVAQQVIQLYEWILNKREKPDFVI